MSNISSSTSSVTPSIPYFVIQGDECCLEWLIKRILLIFQKCYSPETINASVASFSGTNIEWLTPIQIQSLQEDRIRQLGRAQLNAFSQAQIGFFSASQQIAYEQALMQRQEEVIRNEWENASTLQESEEPARHGQGTSTRNGQHVRTEPDVRRGVAVTEELQLTRINVKEYLNDPALQERVNAQLSDDDRAFFSHPLLQEFVNRACESHCFYTFSPSNRKLLKNDILSQHLVVDYIQQNGFEEPAKTFLLFAMEPHHAAFLNQENIDRIKSTPGWYEKYYTLNLTQLYQFRFQVEPKEQLLQLPLSTVWDMEDLDSCLLSAKLNEWNQTENEITFESLEDERVLDYEALKSLSLSAFRSLNPRTIAPLLSDLPAPLLNLLSKQQLRGLQTKLLTRNQVHMLFGMAGYCTGIGNEHKLIGLFSGEQIRDIQDKITESILKTLNAEQIRVLDASVFPQ